MTNLEWLNKLKRDDDGYSDIETSKLEFRTAKALEIIAEELCIANKKLTILIMGKLEMKEDKIKVGGIKYKFPPIEVECPKGFTKKVMDKLKKEEL